jgi:hypothetical protein
LNQLAFPGAGTVMAGRNIGYVQAIVMIIGFVLTMLYLFVVIGGLLSLLTDSRMSEAQFQATRHRYALEGEIGLALCLFAWCWSLASSIAMLRQSQKEPPILR